MKPHWKIRLSKSVYYLTMILAVIAIILGLMELIRTIEPLISGHKWPVRRSWPHVAAIAGKWIHLYDHQRELG